MLKRKIEQALTDWKNTPNHSPLIIKGCRQCGKTYSVRDFAKRTINTRYISTFSKTRRISLFLTVHSKLTTS